MSKICQIWIKIAFKTVELLWNTRKKIPLWADFWRKWYIFSCMLGRSKTNFNKLYKCVISKRNIGQKFYYILTFPQKWEINWEILQKPIEKGKIPNDFPRNIWHEINQLINNSFNKLFLQIHHLISSSDRSKH